jgi:hypothetical protein
MNIIEHYRSLAAELRSLKNRVRNYIEDSHWQTDGEWKESILRSVLSRIMPETAKIGRGFVVTQQYSTTQIDILIYRYDSPVFFREGDLVLVPPEGVLGVLEVKTNVDATSAEEALSKLAHTRSKIESNINDGILFGLFAYDVSGTPNSTALGKLQKAHREHNAVVDLVCLGDSRFIKWWKHNPNGPGGAYDRWHSYTLPELAPGYFIHNVLVHMSRDRYWINQEVWFPSESKEFCKDGEKCLGQDDEG